jgi:membrane dipeptidase
LDIIRTTLRFTFDVFSDTLHPNSALCAHPTVKPMTDIYENSIVIDGLNTSNWDSDSALEGIYAGRVTAINATIAIFEKFHEAMDNIAGWHKRLARNSDTLMQVTSVDDIHEAKRTGKSGVVFGWQNASPIENNLDHLETFHKLGVKIIQITYNERNLLGNGCYERVDDGLSNFGVDAVKEMNRLGILIDLSHVGERTTLETAELSDKPVAATHANAKSFVDHPRNKTDDAIKLIAEKGGVIGATCWPPFLPNKFDSTLRDFGDAIDDMVERIGIDHVGIGTDYTIDQSKEWFDLILSQQGTKFNPRRNTYPDTVTHPVGIETPEKLPAVAEELSGRGYSPEDISKVLGGNFMRVFGEVWG